MLSKLIFETDYWNIFLSDDQTYLGRIVVELRRTAPSLSDLSTEEFSDFHLIVKKYEQAAKKSFGATMFNWACLMNNAYKHTPPDPHVHWHCRPRYNKSVIIAGETFLDPNFGHHYERGTNRAASEEIKNKIIEALQKNLRA